MVIFTAIQIPYYAAFSANTDIVLDIMKSEVRPMLILSLIVDCMFVLDILLNFRTTYISSSDVLERDPKMLAVNYLKTWFIIDLLAAIPFDWIMHYQQQNDGRNVSFMSYILWIFIEPYVLSLKSAKKFEIDRSISEIINTTINSY